MSVIPKRVLLGAISAAVAALWFTPAFPHAVCGSRIFPATLGIDDPGVGDEIALPTVSYVPYNSGGVPEIDASFSYTKTIFPGFGLSVTDGPSWAFQPGGYGWGNIDTEAKYNFFCWPEHEFMGSVGFDMTWANTGTPNDSDPFNTYTPVLDIGKGFGDLPNSLNWLRPIAITAELSETIPDHSWTNGNQNSTNLNWGFTVQYSLPYYNSNVGEISNDFVKHLVPLTELVFSKPISNFAPGTNGITGTVQPGVIYLASSWQFALEAIIPINGASGHGAGVVGELHFYLDDIFPDSLGKPIFGGKL
jgi:hypothetical protein